MADALTPLFAVAAIVLCIAGIAKLREPATAAEAVGAGSTGIRAFALAELGLGAWALVAPSALTAALLAAVYAGFSGLAYALARRRAPCGCFGEHEQPASAVQSILSALLAVAAGLSVRWTPHGLGWLLSHSPVLLIGVAGATYAAVLAYTALPAAWAAWEGVSR